MFTIMVLLALIVALVTTPAEAGGIGDAERGRQWLASQRCTQCHRFGSRWARNVPKPIAKLLDERLTPSRFAGVLWTHAPTMWSAFDREKLARPVFTQSHAEDLIAYFFAAGYFDDAGDANRGKAIFVAKGCAGCHAMGTAAPVENWRLAEVTQFLQGVWSHGPVMAAAMERRLLVWPSLSAEQMRDLLAFFRTGHADSAEVRLDAGSPARGKELLDEKRCLGCHTGTMAFENSAVIHNFAQLSASFWNHAPMMMEKPAVLSAAELSDILAFLWSTRYFEQPGNITKGQDLFTKRQCDSCHQAPKGNAGFSTGDMIAALWKHGPEVVAQAKAKNGTWPRFSKAEMADLIGYWASGGRKDNGPK